MSTLGMMKMNVLKKYSRAAGDRAQLRKAEAMVGGERKREHRTRVGREQNHVTQIDWHDGHTRLIFKAQHSTETTHCQHGCRGSQTIPPVY